LIAVPVFRDGRAISLLFPGLAVAIHMVQLAIDAAGMTKVPLEDLPVLWEEGTPSSGTVGRNGS